MRTYAHSFRIISSVALLAAVADIARAGLTGRLSGLIILAAAAAMGALAITVATEGGEDR